MKAVLIDPITLFECLLAAPAAVQSATLIAAPIADKLKLKFWPVIGPFPLWPGVPSTPSLWRWNRWHNTSCWPLVLSAEGNTLALRLQKPHVLTLEGGVSKVLNSRPGVKR